MQVRCQLQVLILGLGIKAGTVFVDVGQVTVTQDLCFGIFPFESLEQVKQCSLLSGGPGVGVMAVLVEASLITHAQGVAVVTYGMGTYELFVARLVGLAIAGDVVVVARVSKAVNVVADELHHAVALVAACGAAVDNNQLNMPHDCTAMVPTMVVITVATTLRTLATLVQFTLIIVR